MKGQKVFRGRSAGGGVENSNRQNGQKGTGKNEARPKTPSNPTGEPYLPQFDGLLAAFVAAEALDKAIVEHTALARQLFERHTGTLKRHFAWANPFQESFYYCTAVDERGIACTFASDSEKDAQDHIWERHPGTGAHPRRFGLSRFTGGMANFGPSCSVTAAVAALATLEESRCFAPDIRKAFRTSQPEDSRALLRALGLALPTAPGVALEAFAAKDAVIGDLFAAKELKQTICKACGCTSDGFQTGVSAILTYEAPAGPAKGGTAAALGEAFGPTTSDTTAVCPECQTAEPSCMESTHYLFEKAVAVTVVSPEALPDSAGLPDIPLEVDFPTRPFGVSKFLLHAVLCATSPSHVVAYVVERVGNAINWHLYNGTVHKAGAPPPDAKKIDTLVFLPAPPPPPRGGGDQQDDEEGNGHRASTRGANPPPPPPQRPRDSKGRPLYGSEDPEVGEETGETAENGDGGGGGPPSPPPPAETPGAEEDESGGETDAERPQETFVHGKNVHVSQGEGLSCPLCAYNWTSATRRAQQTDHANTAHGQEPCTAAALKAAALDRCVVCGQFVVASSRGRAAHAGKCSAFETRAARNSKRARAGRETPDIVVGGAVLGMSPAAGPAHRHQERPTEEDEEWTRTFPATIRTLRKQEWGIWAETVGQTLLGYTAAPQGDRHQRQIAMTNLVRTRLAKPRPAEEGGNEEAGRPETEAQRNTDEVLPTKAAQTTEEKRHRRILHQISLGALGKAARTLFNAQLPRARASEVEEQLRELHPQEDPAGYPTPPRVIFPHDLKPEKVKKIVVQRLGRASAPGLDGWTRELLVPIVENKSLLQEFTTLLQDILAERVSPSFAYRIRACVLHPFLKEAGSAKVRPITPESVFLKIASHAALGAVEKSFREVFRGWQFGVWGDAAEAVKQIRASYASASADTLVALDAANAYNRFSRKRILSAFYAHKDLRPAFGVVDLALGNPGALGVYEAGVRTQNLASTRGVRQGMVLGPLLFATAMAEIIRPLLAKHPAAKITAYLDDLTVVGPRAAVQAFLDEAGPLLAEAGFEINPAKSHHLSKNVVPEPVVVVGAVVPVAAGVVRILGAGFLGNAAPVEEWVWEKVGHYEAYFSALEDERLPRHARLNLLRASALPRLTFLLRTHCPQELERSAAWFDDRVLLVLSSLLGGAVLDETALLIAKLPMVMGGFGLRSQIEIAKFASASVGRKTAQREQTRVVDQKVGETLFPLLSEPCLALLKANAAPGATRALVDPSVRLADFAFDVLARQRLMLRVLRPGVCCACGADASNQHVNVCSSLPGGPRILRHNRVVMAIDAWAKQLGLSVVTEPRVGTASRERLDLTIATAAENFATDVVITYPGRARFEVQNPLQQSHGEKKRKWANWARESGAVFAPVSLESTGGLHKESFEWMLSVAGSGPFPYSARTALSELLSSVCQAVHEGNSFQFATVKNLWARSLLRNEN